MTIKTIALFHFDEETTSESIKHPKDELGNVKIITPTSNAPAISSGGKFGNAATMRILEGNSETELTMQLGEHLVVGEPFTIEMQLSVPSSTSPMFLMSLTGEGDPLVRHYMLTLVPGMPTEAGFVLYSDATNTEVFAGYTPDTYHHLVLMYDGEKIHAYVDGIHTTLPKSTKIPDGAPLNLHIANLDASSAVQIDELRISKGAVYADGYVEQTAPFTLPSQVRISQIKAVGVKPLESDSLKKPTKISQIKAVSVKIESGAMPKFATHLMQLRNAALIGSLTDEPGPRNFLTQLQVMGVVTTPTDLNPLLYNIHKQVLNETEPAMWLRVHALQNLVLKQEFKVGETRVHSLQNTLLIQDESPNSPPTYSYTNRATLTTKVSDYVSPIHARSCTNLNHLHSIYSTREVLKHPLLVRSFSNSFKVKASSSERITMRNPENILAGTTAYTATGTTSFKVAHTNPEALQSLTNSLLSAPSVAVKDTLGKPESLQSDTKHINALTHLTKARKFKDPTFLMSATKHLSAGVGITELQEYRPPESIKPSYKSFTLKPTSTQRDLKEDPSFLQSLTSAHTLIQSVTSGVPSKDPLNVRSATSTRVLIGTVVQESGSKEDPNFLQSPTHTHIVKASYLEKRTLKNPEDMSISVQNVLTIQSTTEKVEMPEEVRSTSRLLTTYSHYTYAEDYINPSWLYEEPARLHGISNRVTLRAYYPRPADWWVPVVNINYYWK